jgi:hypothetical protein
MPADRAFASRDAAGTRRVNIHGPSLSPSNPAARRLDWGQIASACDPHGQGPAGRVRCDGCRQRESGAVSLRPGLEVLVGQAQRDKFMGKRLAPILSRRDVGRHSAAKDRRMNTPRTRARTRSRNEIDAADRPIGDLDAQRARVPGCASGSSP